MRAGIFLNYYIAAIYYCLKNTYTAEVELSAHLGPQRFFKRLKRLVAWRNITAT
jgi:hypothetical protein